MTTYIDVGVVRIQTYLARTPKLRLRRGASWLLSSVTSDEEIQDWLDGLDLPGVALNPDAGHADGVVHLVAPEGQEHAVAERLMLHLRGQLPAADIQASWATGATYLDAIGAGPRTPKLEALVAAPDFPLGHRCDECRVDARVGNGTRCADCGQRDTVGGRRPSLRPGADDGDEDAMGTERDLLDTVNFDLGRRLRAVRSTSDLAKLGDGDTDHNHIATIAFDGNAMGAFFDAARSGDHSVAARLSAAVSDATRTALTAATTAIVHGDDPVLPVVPHVLGGDDVLVSVVADRAWKFTGAFLKGFSDAIGQAADRLALSDDTRAALPTMSAGLVFSHHKFPFARAVILADQVLRRAKTDWHGRTAACGWLDTTVDGEQIPNWRCTLSAAELNALHADLYSLSLVPSSGRATLARLLADPDPDQARAAALVAARRNNWATVSVLLERGGPERLRNLVSLSRWWRS